MITAVEIILSSAYALLAAAVFGLWARWWIARCSDG